MKCSLNVFLDIQAAEYVEARSTSQLGWSSRRLALYYSAENTKTSNTSCAVFRKCYRDRLGSLLLFSSNYFMPVFCHSEDAH